LALDIVIIILLLGAVAGLAAGLLGVGGGLIIVPVLSWLFYQQGVSGEVLMQLAVGTSLATIVATSISSAWAHYRHQAILLPVLFSLTPGILLGAMLGAYVADALPEIGLRRVFAIFELLVAVQMFFNLRPAAHWQLPGRIAMVLAGMAIGLLSAIVGIGGGTLTVPFLVACAVPVRNAIATSAACGFPIALAGSLGFIMAGWQQQGLPEYSLGYVYLPAFLGIIIISVLTAPLGAWLAHHLPVAVVKRLFALFLLAVGIRMLWAW
jgi:uncharacterized membrane protein YfcA